MIKLIEIRDRQPVGLQVVRCIFMWVLTPEFGWFQNLEVIQWGSSTAVNTQNQCSDVSLRVIVLLGNQD